MKRKIDGVIPILSAPFSEHGEIVYEDLRRMTEFTIQSGANAVALFGIASEFHKVSDKERDKMMDTVITQVRGRVPTVISITRHSRELAVKDAKLANQTGADVLMVLPPYFMGPNESAIKEHIIAIAEAVDLPLIIQYNPGATNVGISADFFIQICELFDRQVYIKLESNPAGHLISRLMQATKGELGVLIGNAGRYMVDAFSRGATGVMPGCSMPEVYKAIYGAFKAGSIDDMRSIHNELIALINLIGQSAEMIIKFEKIILARRGVINSDYCRAPGFEPDDQYLELFEKYYQPITRFFGDHSLRVS